MPVGISYRAMLAAAGSSAAADAYIVNSFAPPVVADFAGVLNSGTPYFRVGGSDSSFASMFTFARSSTAYYRASDGTLTQASSGTERKDHYKWNGSSWVRAGILLESEARTNLITQSDDMSGWTTSNMTVAKNQTGADGAANSAHSLTATSGSATVLTTITAASNPHVYSALVKRITGTGTIEMTVNGGTNWVNVTSLINSSEFIQVGTGAGTTVTNPQVGFRITTSGDAIAVQVNQLEQTSGQFSSPIPTSGATVTRAAETLTIAGANMSYSATAMSFHMQGTRAYNNGSTNQAFWSWYNNASNFLMNRIGSGDQNVFIVESGGVSDLVLSPVDPFTADAFNDYNVACRITSSEMNACDSVNGSAYTANTTLSSIADVSSSNFSFANYNGGQIINTMEIGLFRQWAVDIGDTGIESATS